MMPMALRPMVMQLERTKGPPTFSMRGFHAKRMMTGKRNTMREARLFRHWVVRSARRSAEKAPVVEDRVMGAEKVAGEPGVIVGEEMVFDMDEVFFMMIFWFRTGPRLR